MTGISDKMHISYEMYYFNNAAFLAHYTHLFRAILRLKNTSFCSNEIYISAVSHDDPLCYSIKSAVKGIRDSSIR